MKSTDQFLEHHVNRLIDSCLASGLEMPPVDLHEIARRSAVLAIKDQRMIPEAVLSTEAGGFCIYLQSNFKDFPGAEVRQRFSLAHEIAHTFFYKLRDGVQKPNRGAPRGDELERACHIGAGLLLVPQRFLIQEIRRIDGPIGAKHTLDLARKFDVSVEVMLRRLHQVRAFESTDLALVLVRRPQKSEAVIEFATYPPWLRTLLPTPQRGLAFASWLESCGPDFRPAEVGLNGKSDPDECLMFERGLRKRTRLGVLHVSPFDVTRSQQIFELRI